MKSQVLTGSFMITHLRISGLLFVLLGLAHAGFGRRLNWKSDLAKLTLVNRQIFHVHSFYAALLLVMLGSLSVFYAEALLQPSPLTRAVLGGMTLLWAIRLYVQWFVFDKSLWRGNGFNTAAHYLFTFFWAYVTAVDGLALLRACRHL
jgi:hypothetical protein